MAKVRVVLNSQGVTELLKSPEVQDFIGELANGVKVTAGDGHEMEVSVGRNRARAMVWTDTLEAMRSEATNHTLTRAISPQGPKKPRPKRYSASTYERFQ